MQWLREGTARLTLVARRWEHLAWRICGRVIRQTWKTMRYWHRRIQLYRLARQVERELTQRH